MTATTAPLRLSEEFVQDCFHSYLKSSLTQAKVERLVDTELLSSAEGDLMITGRPTHQSYKAQFKLNEIAFSTRSRTLLVLCSSKMYHTPAICTPSKAKEQGWCRRHDHRSIRK